MLLCYAILYNVRLLCKYQAINKNSFVSTYFQRCFGNAFQKKLIYKGRVTRVHISEILYSVIFPKYYPCVSLIISNCFLAAAQLKHWVKNLSLYNLMAARTIDKPEIAYMFFLRIIHCHNGIGYEEKVEEKNLGSGMVTKAKRKRSL